VHKCLLKYSYSCQVLGEVAVGVSFSSHIVIILFAVRRSRLPQYARVEHIIESGDLMSKPQVCRIVYYIAENRLFELLAAR
jgi:hypothetical protein